MIEATTTNERRLILGVVAEGVGLPQMLQDYVQCHQDVTNHARILRDALVGRHAKIYQNLGDVPRQNHQPLGPSDIVPLGVLADPPELDELQHLFMVVLGVDSTGLHLRQRRLT
jgi:hypothetical protein